jgi:hypothetical protein
LHNNAKRWRQRLAALATLAAVLVGGSALVAPAAAFADTATLSRQPFGPTSYVLKYTITNDTNVPMTSWRMEFDLPAGQYVQGFFSLDIRVTQTGQHFVLQNANPILEPPGGSHSSGVVIVGSSWPLNCVTRGTPCILSP